MFELLPFREIVGDVLFDLGEHNIWQRKFLQCWASVRRQFNGVRSNSFCTISNGCVWMYPISKTIYLLIYVFFQMSGMGMPWNQELYSVGGSDLWLVSNGGS